MSQDEALHYEKKVRVGCLCVWAACACGLPVRVGRLCVWAA
jgi:hypothetical protein